MTRIDPSDTFTKMVEALKYKPMFNSRAPKDSLSRHVVWVAIDTAFKFPEPELVEDIAKADYALLNHADYPWEDQHEDLKEMYRKSARRHIEIIRRHILGLGQPL